MFAGSSGRFVWVCMMVLMAVISLGLGLIGVKDRLQTKPAQMALDPSLSEIRRKALQNDLQGPQKYIPTAVQYRFEDGRTLLHPTALLEKHELSNLLAGQTLAVYHNRSKPNAVLTRADLPQPAGWLILGAVLSAVAGLAWRLWKQEQTA